MGGLKDMARKFFPEQKDVALETLEGCEFTKDSAEEVEKTLYTKFRNESEIQKKFGDYCSFINWYCEQITGQDGNCFYCGLNGNIAPYYNPVLRELGTDFFEKGKRKNCGERLEIDKKNSSAGYIRENCALV